MSFLGTLLGAGALDSGEQQRRLLERQAAVGEFDTISPLYAFFAANTDAGKLVTVERALGLTAVYAAVRILSDTVGMLPLQLQARLQGGGTQEAWYESLHGVLAEAPNGEMTAATLWSLVMAHLNLWGDAFLGKEFAGNQLVGLWPIRPDRVRVERRGGVKLYWVRDNFGVEASTPYTDADVIHIMGMSIDGIRGISPIEVARQSIGAGLALDEYANHFWSNGAFPALAVVGPEDEKDVTDDVLDRRERRWRKKFRGSRRSNKVVFLQHGSTIEKISVPLKDQQFVEQQKWGVQQAARVFRVPMSLIAGESVDSSLTYRTVDGDAVHFLTHSVQPWLVRIEQGLMRHKDIFTRRQLFARFDTEALLRSDIKTRSEADYRATGGRPWKLPSEVRSGYNLPPDKSLDELPPTPVPLPTDSGAR